MDDKQVLHEKVRLVLCEFFDEEYDLLKRNVNERSIAHKLAEHLQRQFEGLKVDCEYNRLGDDLKTLYPKNTQTARERVFPDIVVHRRGDDGLVATNW